MIRLRRLLPLAAAALFGATVLGAPTEAQAAFKLTIAESGGASVTIEDGGSGDLASQSGTIMFAGALGDFNIQLSMGTSTANPNGIGPAQLTINNTSISSGGFSGTRTITITLEDTGFTSPGVGNGNMLSQLSTTQVPTGTSVTFQSILDNPGTGNDYSGTLLSLNTVGGSSANDFVEIGSSPYTLRNVTTYTMVGQGSGNMITVQSTGATVVTPAPAGLILALSGLPVLGLGCWLRRRGKA